MSDATDQELITQELEDAEAVDGVDGAEPEELEIPDKPVELPEVQLIPLEDIHLFENIRNPTAEGITRLALNIRKRGLQQPVRVRPAQHEGHGKPWELVFGYRRFLAFRRNEQELVPALVVAGDDADILADALSENVEREDQSPVEQARTMQRMIDLFGWTHAQIAGHMGCDRSQVTKSLALLKLPPKVVEMIDEGKITRSHAEVIGSLDTPQEQEEVADLAVRSEAPVSKLSSYVKKIKEEKEATAEETIRVADENTPLEPTELVPTPLPRLELRDDLEEQDIRAGQLYMTLRAANDVEMLEYLEAQYNVSWELLWDFVNSLTAEQVDEMLEVMTRRWLGAAHRYPTLPEALREHFGSGSTFADPPEPQLPDGSAPLSDDDEGEDYRQSLDLGDDFADEFLDDNEF